eukprot:CAMPEP_0172557356 /NCGR_PEP_ID=MMETSP1067-20121228/72796_1 /TAXON_ID=265564 ORGANISM="Thalassiosira punctigera, Strain Tpunct2005C2" /NCGR_SAMPLE_ID=MMETSP1067 /ASSEMBLY_ACC=CAM_ASM_000444 /LENGTH=248 /DNA_ID=CAMNT_0013346417 /DNA_START=177 /DNA_END=923 /DNA_ORIENTATION=+
MTRGEALKTIPCPFFATGSCRYGEYCELKHDEVKENDDAVCGICLENVPSLKRNFGILSCCLHTFCHSCLMEWRTEGSNEVTSRRVCPTCRKTSDFVVPSLVMPANDEERDQILQNYKTKLSTIPCKNFEVGQLGSCSFGSDCFYAHLDRKGKDIKQRDKTMNQLYEERQRHRNDGEQDIEYITDMIVMMGLQRHMNRRSMHGRNRRGQRDESGVEEEDDIFISPYMMNFIASLMGDDDDLDHFLMRS